MTSIKKIFLSAILGAALVGGQAANAAAIIDFTDGAGHDLTTFSTTLSDSSATATFSNVSIEGSPDDFFNLNNGLALGSGGLGHTWTVVFDSTVTLSGVDLGFSSSNLGFNIAGVGLAVNDLMAGLSVGSYSIAPITFLASELYTFTSNNLCATTGCGGVTFETWDFGSASVPESSSFALMAIGLVGIGLRRKKLAA